jgi:TrmH family RNA methyltransferase
LEGHRLVLDALHSGLVPSEVFLSDKAVEAPLGRSLLCALLQEQEQEQHQGRAVADGSNDSERERECVRECGVAPVLYWTSSDVMSRLTTTSTTQGVCAIVPHSDDRFCIRERELSSLVVCDGVADPGNLGTIIRTSHAMNVEGVVVVGGCTPWVSTHSLTHSLTQ